MTAKEFLRQYGDCEKRIQSRLRRIQRLKEQADDISVTLSERVQSSGSGDSQAKIIDTYIDMENELKEEVLRLKKVQADVKAAINALNDSRQKNVLERYYLEGMTFEETAVSMHYSYMQICRIHGQALLNLNDVIECYIDPMI